MTTKTAGSARRHPLLEVRLAAVARKLRDVTLHRRSALAWAGVTLAGCACLIFRYTTGYSISWAGPAMFGLISLATFRAWLDSRRTKLDLTDAVGDVQRRFPEMGQALRTAYEQRTDDGHFNFLQKRVISQVLEHAERNLWTPPKAPLLWWKRLHLLFLLGAFVTLFGIVAFDRASPGKQIASPSLFSSALTILPGNAEFEKGSIVVVTARFSGAMPADAQLEWTIPGSPTRTGAMAKSFSDPLFAFTLPQLETSLSYRVRYETSLSELYQLTVYTLPSLVRADASLSYPEYTGLAPKIIGETRRVSAVEGSHLSYEFTVNKPLRRAVLVEKDQPDIVLEAIVPDRTRFRLQMPVTRSHRFLLQLEDEQGRQNNPTIDVRVEALPNRRPEPKIVAPVGDVRVSPLEEVQLVGTARDEFGLLDYGVAFSFGGSEPEYISLKNDRKAPIETRFNHVLSLEQRKLQAGEVVTWFAWADDFGPDGARRRTDGDLQFGEIRPLDEIFREDESGGGSESSGEAGSEEGQELLELQRQISLAIWKQRQEHPTGNNWDSDLEAVSQSQAHVRSQLEKSLEQISDPKLRENGERALTHMERVQRSLQNARDRKNVEPLRSAWSEAQSAFQEMLKMLPQETSVTQSSSRSRARGGQRGNQRQINQLDFKDAENRYETATEAQPITSPEQKEQLQALSKLRELARRQQETNERLQELQTALNAARDEVQREQIQRELKRLEEEQRRLLADTDELRDRMDQMSPSERTRQAREQLEQTREDMRRSGEKLEKGEVSSALASGTRAAEDLEKIGDEFRKNANSQFSEQLRQARQDARELAEAQSAAEQAFKDLNEGQTRSLDDSPERENVARSIESLREKRDTLLQQLRQIAEDSETSEPGLHRRLYDLLREHGQGTASEQLSASAEMLRRGFVPQAQDAQTKAGRDVQELRRRVDRAAESVLGDESTELRYAQKELEDLSRQLDRERTRAAGNQPDRNAGDQESGTSPRIAEKSSEARPANAEGDRSTEAPNETSPNRLATNEGSNLGPNEKSHPTEGAQPSGDSQGPGASGMSGQGQPLPQSDGSDPNTPSATPGGGLGGGPRTGQQMAEGLRRLLDDLRQNGRAPNGPITGEGFGEWIERLRTVEELTQVPEARQRLAEAREQAEAARRDFKRHSRAPEWGSVESGIATPLNQARTLLRQELSRLQDPDALQPVDRDPVPEKYAESVRRYYESLGQ